MRGVAAGSSPATFVPEGTYVKKGATVCTLDTSVLKDQYVNQGVAEEKAVSAYENAKLAREAAELAEAEYDQGTSKRERDAAKGEISGLKTATRKAEERLAIARVSPGQKARIHVDAFPNQTLAGVVKLVAPLSEARHGAYPTWVLIENGAPSLRPGMTAGVEILAERADVLSVPVEAVVTNGGKARVATKQPDGGFDWRVVTLGITSDKVVEVIHGLKPGESVALDPTALLGEEEK